MNKKIILAISLFAIGVINIVDWILFSTSNEDLAFSELIKKYEKRFPLFLQSFYSNHGILLTFLYIIAFTIAGIIFINTKKRIWRIFGIISFILGFWKLFSLM